MKYLKTLALASVAAGALIAFVGDGTASATVLCSTTVSECPAAQRVSGTLHLSLSKETSALLVNTKGEALDTCSGAEVQGNIEKVGGATETPSGPVTSLTWTSCSFPTSTVTKGELEIHQIAGTSNGTLTAKSAFDVTINTVLFGSCIYGVTKGTSIGDLTEGNPAVFHANAVAERFSGSAFACPETSKWTATYTVTKPATTISVSAK